MSISAMKRMAKAESKAVRRSWGETVLRGPQAPSGAVNNSVRKYAGTGMEQKEVAAILGCSTSAISKACSRLGVDWKTGKPTS